MRTVPDLIQAAGDAVLAVLQEELDERLKKDEKTANIQRASDTYLAKTADAGLLNDALTDRQSQVTKDFSADAYAVGDKLGSYVATWVNKLVAQPEQKK